MQINAKDAAAGCMFAGLGLFFAGYAYLNLRIGSAHEMGPGYFPLSLGLLSFFIGAAVLLKSFGARSSPFDRTSARGILLVTLSIGFFGLTVRSLGLVPAVAGSTIIASLASARTTFRQAALVTIGMTIFCTVLFVYLLGLPIPAVAYWLRGV
jgi:hypothetical protein